MARRGANGQAAHDRAVDELAARHEGDGWRVWADVDGWPTPPSVRGRRPDVLARDGGAVLVLEVETDPDADAAQHEKFRAEAAENPDCQFIGYIVDYEGEVTSRFS